MDLADDRIRVSCEEQMIGSGELHQPRPRYTLGEVSTVIRTNDLILRVAKDQRGDADAFQDCTEVELCRDANHRFRFGDQRLEIVEKFLGSMSGVLIVFHERENGGL